MASKKPTSSKRLSAPKTASEAYAAVRSEIEAFPSEALIPINIDIPAACTLALGTADLIESLRADLATLPNFDHRSVAKLRVYALAALYANAVYTDSLNDRSLKALLEEAGPLRENLLVAAEALAHRDLVSASRVAEIRRGQGHHDTANDLIALSALFRESWSLVQGKTAVTRHEFQRAGVLGSELHTALGAKQVGTDGRTASQELWNLRQRAFSVFVRAYEECRRGVSFLRWHERDADQFAPSLYRKRRRAANGIEEEFNEPASENEVNGAVQVPLDRSDDEPGSSVEILEST